MMLLVALLKNLTMRFSVAKSSANIHINVCIGFSI